MASTWTVELQFDNFTNTPDPAPSAGTRRNGYLIGVEAICLPLGDMLPQFNPAGPDDGGFYFGVAVVDDPPDRLVQFATTRVASSTVEPTLWTSKLGGDLYILSGTTAAIAAGGTLTITKDYDSDLISFIGPLGTQTLTLTELGYLNTTPLRPRGYAEQVLIPDPTGSTPAYDIDDSIQYYNLVGKENGVTYETIALSAADPGVWWPPYGSGFDPASSGVTLDLSPWVTYSQLASRQKVDFAVQAIAYPEFRQFNFLRRRMVPSNDALDMVQVREHGPFYAAIVYSSDPTTVKVRKTYDNGTSWTESVLYTAGGTLNNNPSIQSANGRLFVAWEQSGELLQSTSPDLGASWSTPVTLSITGTNPRLIVDPRHKVSFYFSIDGSGTLMLQRSGNFGTDFIDATPITVATGVGQQTVTAAFAADGSIVVGYIDSGAWTQLRSRDYGVSWS